jgi:DNA-binding NarL/FixJ family response regulator
VIPVLLIDDHQAVLDALRALLERESGFTVVDAVPGIKKALAVLHKQSVQLVVMDVRLGEDNSLDAIPEVKSAAPSAKLVMLSMYADEAYVFRALQLGADGYVVKHAPSHELVEAARSVMRGERFIGSGISLEKLASYERQSRSLSADPLDRLTPRERAVAKLVVDGATSDEIGAKHGISRRTVESHRANLAQKLGVSRPIDLVRLLLGRSWKDG